MEPIILNVCEIYAKNENEAHEARRRWIARSEALDIMYDNIPGLQDAKLETKNYIYDKLNAVVFELTK